MLQVQITNFDIAVISLVLFLLVYKFITMNNNYWKNRNVFYIQPKPIFGNIFDFVMSRKTVGEIYKEHYDANPNEKYIGIFTMRTPVLVIKDPEIIKHVLIKNFNCFQNRLDDFDETKERMLRHLFSARNEDWKNTRQKLTPAFTSGKLKNMFYLILEKGEEFRKCMDVIVENGEEREVRDLLAKFTTDVIGSCAFGLQMNSMLDSDDMFRRTGREIFRVDYKKQLKGLARAFSPSLFYAMGFKMFSKNVENFFVSVIKDIVDQRRNQVSKRNDFIDLLLEIKHKDGKEDSEMNNLYMAAQAFIFFAAGFETSSTLMAFVLYELAMHPEIQDKLVKEIHNTLEKYDGQLTYDGINEMEYLELVEAETLRKYPALGFIPRSCTVTHKLPDSDLVIDKGTKIAIPVLALHYDPHNFPDPEKFIPERFTTENRKNRHPMVYLPFGDGPRNCIGLRFGKIQSKVGLITFLRNYSVEPSRKTKKIIFEPKNFVSAPRDGIWLKIKKR